jgi:hypothetical protein
MPEPSTTPNPRTTPSEHDKPVFQPGNPGTPTPEDPRQNEPIQDPPVDPEQAKGNVLFDENRKPG